MLQAVSAGASVVSMSWGGGEFSGEQSYDTMYFSTPGVTYFAATGDGGCGTIYPSTSPDVIAVGGTVLISAHLHSASHSAGQQLWQ